MDKMLIDRLATVLPKKSIREADGEIHRLRCDLAALRGEAPPVRGKLITNIWRANEEIVRLATELASASQTAPAAPPTASAARIAPTPQTEVPKTGFERMAAATRLEGADSRIQTLAHLHGYARIRAATRVKGQKKD